VGVLANDSDPDPGDTISVSSNTDPAHGTASCSPLDCNLHARLGLPRTRLLHLHDLRQRRQDRLGHGDHHRLPAQPPPVAQNDSASTAINTAVTVGVLANDSDPDPGDTISVSSNTDPAHGTGQLQPA